MLTSLISRPARLLYACLVFMASVIYFASMVMSAPAGLAEPPNGEKTTSLAERLDKRQAEQQLDIGSELKQRILSKCEVAQGLVNKLKTRDGVTRDKYKNQYFQFAEKLETITTGLAKQGVSTSALVSAQQRITEAINQYLVDAESYRVAINDLASISCQSNPEGFYITLQAARASRKELKTDVDSVTRTVPDIKNALAKIKSELEQQ